MNRISYPPFIVFFDSLAVFLFLLMMNQNESITTELPKDELFFGAEIVVKKNGDFFYANKIPNTYHHNLR